MIVMKFGGTSVEDAAAIRRLIEIVKRGRHRKPLVVVSACSGVTNDLIRTAHAVRDGDKDQALNILDRLRIRHRTMADAQPVKNIQRLIFISVSNGMSG